jgi:hypothetical protein
MKTDIKNLTTLDKIFPGDGRVTLEVAKNWLRPRAKQGAYCPCCKQHVKVYRRALGSQMVRWLIWLVRVFEQLPKTADGGWVNIKESPVRGGDYGKLVHWGVVESRSNSDPALRTSGLWRPTAKGIDFVQQRIALPSHVVLYNNEIMAFSDETIKIREALGKRFDFAELMNAPVKVQVPV